MTIPTPVLQVEDLAVCYGKVEAVSGVSLTVPPASIVTVIGPNGAGKTTTLSALMGLLPVRAGTIRVDGQPVGTPEVSQMVDHGIALVPESRELFGSMSIEDNLVLGAFHRHRQGARDSRQTMEQVYDLFPRLRERRTQAAGTLSGGERQMLAVGRALMAKPRLLMLDEPSLGLAPLIVRDIFRILVDLRQAGIAILLVEQNARAALQVADHGYVLENGIVRMDGPAETLRHDPRVIESYLGLNSKHQQMLAS